MKNNLKNGKPLPVFHGELILIPVDDISFTGDTKKSKKEILAHSETGHHHILESDTEFELVTSGIDRAVIITELSKLWHNKSHDIHQTIEIHPGKYIVREKQEYNPFTKIMQRVFD